MDEPRCGKCGEVMKPADSKIRPELFLHDRCLPDELRPAAEDRDIGPVHLGDGPMSRREKIIALAAHIRNEVAGFSTAANDGAWLMVCNNINSDAADLVRLTREEACSIVDAKMKS